jgi:hypothetical protein
MMKMMMKIFMKMIGVGRDRWARRDGGSLNSRVTARPAVAPYLRMVGLALGMVASAWAQAPRAAGAAAREGSIVWVRGGLDAGDSRVSLAACACVERAGGRGCRAKGE